MSFSLTAHNTTYLYHFGEAVTFRRPGMADRDIVAVVNRGEPVAMQENGRLLTAQLTVWVRNSQTSTTDDTYGGISATELDTTRDTLSLPLRAGGLATERRIIAIIEQDAGGLLLGVA